MEAELESSIWIYIGLGGVQGAPIHGVPSCWSQTTPGMAEFYPLGPTVSHGVLTATSRVSSSDSGLGPQGQ